MSRFFLQLTAAASAVMLSALAGYSLAADAQSQCYVIASVIKVAGLCDASKNIRMGALR